MSAGTQLQMAPQTTVIQGGQTVVHNQDSNMSTGSSHSDKDVESLGTGGTTSEKIPRTPTDRKRKRKAPDDIQGPGNGGPGGGIGGTLTTTGTGNVLLISGGVIGPPINNKGPRVTLPITDGKKINDYFSKHTTTGNSPIRQLSTGAKSPSPQHGAYPMYPPSPQPPQLTSISGAVTQEFLKNRSTSNPVPSTNIQILPQQQQQQICQQQQQHLQQQPTVVTQNQTPSVMITKSTQTELSYIEIQERDTDLETSKTKLDELTRLCDEQKLQVTANQKVIDQHKSQMNKCIDVVKKLLKEKSNIEKKEARQRCMQNRLRLGQFVTQRVGATFQENWTDGYAFQELARRQEEIATEREEIDKQKKILMKKRPSNSDSRKRSNSSTSTSSSLAASLHNGDSGGFLKPDAVAGGYTQQEYYECDEILKLRQNALKKEDADLQLEMEKLERERNLHIRELKRIHNEDQSRFNNHPVLNERYLLLMLLGKGGFSEVHKAFDLKEQRYVACKVHQLNKDWKEDKKANYIK